MWNIETSIKLLPLAFFADIIFVYHLIFLIQRPFLLKVTK